MYPIFKVDKAYTHANKLMLDKKINNSAAVEYIITKMCRNVPWPFPNICAKFGYENYRGFRDIAIFTKKHPFSKISVFW